MAAAAGPRGTALTTLSLTVGGVLRRRGGGSTIVVALLLGALSLSWAQRTNEDLLAERNAAYRDAGGQYLAVETVRSGVVLSFDAQSVLSGWVGRQVADQDRLLEATAKDQLAEANRRIDTGMAAYVANSRPSTARDRALGRLRTNLDLWRAMQEHLRTGAPMPAGTETASAAVVSTEINEDMESLADLERQRRQATADRATAIYDGARNRLLVALVTLVLAGMVIAFVVVRVAARVLLWFGRGAAATAGSPFGGSAEAAGGLAGAAGDATSRARALLDALAADAPDAGTGVAEGRMPAASAASRGPGIEDLAAAVFADWAEPDSDQLSTSAVVGAGAVVASVGAGTASIGRRTAYAMTNRGHRRRQRPPGRGSGYRR